jgi:hypothetical protein
VLAGQQHIADILDPETFTKQLLQFLHSPTIRGAGSLGDSGTGQAGEDALISHQWSYAAHSNNVVP